MVLSIIIPFYNEQENISLLLAHLNNYYLNRKIDFEVLFVDDGSTDSTVSIIEKYKFLFPVRIILLSRNFGSHAAIRAGFISAKGDYTCYLPADLQISVESVANQLNESKGDFEIIFGVRKNPGIGLVERALSRMYAYLMRKFVSPNFPDEGIETVIISKKVRDVLNKNIEANSSFALQLLSLGFNTKFQNIEKREREKGISKWTLSKKVKLLIDSFVAFSYAPIRFVTYAGITIFLIGIFWTIYIVLRKLIYDDLASGWPMLTSILFLGFGLTNISLGIIAEYLWRTLDTSRKRPVFVIDKIIEIEGFNANET